jgi:ABC-type uncharacterized transport system substrate-binding protein
MKPLLTLCRHLGAGVALIVAASAVLLVSDPKWNRQDRQDDAPRKIAIVNYVSVPVLEEGEDGLVAGLAEAGFVDGENVELTYFNAAGDRATATLIAKEVTGADYDMILTLSTTVLQAVAAANQDSKRTHVFTLTTDPWGAGVGISRDDPSQHPPYMTGYGSLQPVEGLFTLARESNPKLKKVGVVWNPAESNSEASTRMARDACKKLGIELVEATVESSAAVLESTKALVSQEVEAIWVGGDATVSAAQDTLIATARDAGVLVFTNMPLDVKRGAAFSLGADYYALGHSSGLLAARVLRGAGPAAIPVENFMPEQLAINTLAMELFKANWKIGSDWREKAKIVVDESGVHEEERLSVARHAQPRPGHTYQVSIVYFAPNSVTDATIAGLQKKLAERGFIQGRNIEYETEHAQGDIALIPSIMQKLDQSETDLIVALTTPCLAGAATTVKSKPVVFTEVYDPIAAGAGTSAEDHLPHITGVGSFPPLEEMIDTMQMLVPKLMSIGVVYNSAEANSRKAVSVARSLVAERGLRLEEATVSNTSEVLQAAQVLAQRNVDVLWEIGDNTVNQGLEALIKAGRDAGMPVVNNDAESCARGSLAGVGISFYESGYAAGELAARVLLGENPAKIPFQELAVVRVGVNLSEAKQLNFSLADPFLAKCHVFHGIASRLGRPAKLAFVQLVESSSLDKAALGVFEGLSRAGLVTDRDLEVQRFSAQGDLSQLPQIFQAVQATSPDLIVTSTTPAMIAAARSTTSIPIVFTVASEPSAVGVHPPGQRRPNLTGVYDDPPIAELLDLAQRHVGVLKTVGTIWNPAEPNSLISVTRLRRVCQERGIQLIERNASAANELREVTSAICQSKLDILVISADNVTSTGFPAIHSVAHEHGIPVYCTEPDLVAEGAAGAIGVNFDDWGRQTALLAARVLAGQNPATIPLEKVSSMRTEVADSLRK